MKKDYYKILKVSKNASPDEIKQSYKDLVKIYHPDNNPGNEETFKEIGEAYRVLSNPQTKEDYDNTINSINNSTNKADYNQDTYDIFNSLFKDYIKKYNEEREEYIRFLDEMEPKFNKYNRSLKNEKEAILKSNWSLVEMLDSFYEKKSRIRERFDDLERNAKAFDEFLIFFAEAQKKVEQYGFSLNDDIKKSIEPSKRGGTAANYYSDLKTKINRQIYDLEKNIQAFDEHMEFLDKMEEQFSLYNRTIKKLKDELKGKRGQVEENKIYEQQRSIREHLFELERRAKAFDEFSEYYLKANQEMQTLYGKKLINYDKYLDPKNRVSFTETELFDNERKIRNRMFELGVEKDKKLDHLKNEIKNKGLDFLEYFKIRGINPRTTSVTNINTMLKSMELIDQINEILMLYGITIEDYLKQNGKELINISYKELLEIKDDIKNSIMMQNTEYPHLIDIDFNYNETMVPPSGSLRN